LILIFHFLAQKYEKRKNTDLEVKYKKLHIKLYAAKINGILRGVGIFPNIFEN